MSPSATLELEAGTDDGAAAEEPLGERVVHAVQSLPAAERSLRPAKLAALLGHSVSVNEACAELCGLMAAVGGGEDGASFQFERMEGQHVMVFTFPADFAQRALLHRRREERWQDFYEFLRVLVRGLKILTAFGLILSLFILCVAAMVGVVAVLVANNSNQGRGGGGAHRALMLRQLQSLFYTFRQLLWCYAVYAPDMEEGDDTRDPFLRETAFDVALMCSVCCGNPGSLFWFWRARQLSNRRHRIYRGWATRSSRETRGSSNNSGVEGVTLIRRGTWGSDEEETVVSGGGDDHRGLLSVAVEFLFGPNPFHPSSEADKWKLRAAVIVQTSTESELGGVRLVELAPYADLPPASTLDTARILEQGLLDVAYFNGTPKESVIGEKESLPSSATFIFPELMAESTTVLRYEPRRDDASDGSFLSSLYSNQGHLARGTSPRHANTLPSYWKEPYYWFTKLPSAQFFYCLGLGLLNAIGVYSLGQSLLPSGALGPLVRGTLRSVLVGGLLPVLRFYALLFFALPLGRLVLVAWCNRVRRRRNAQRQGLAEELALVPKE
jgi:hypothetical protein